MTGYEEPPSATVPNLRPAARKFFYSSIAETTIVYPQRWPWGGQHDTLQPN
jgi:hypothetical protein